jgi:hypothetical protein
MDEASNIGLQVRAALSSAVPLESMDDLVADSDVCRALEYLEKVDMLATEAQELHAGR